MNTFKKITLTSAVAFALFAFNACGDDSGSTSASGENGSLSSAVEDDESSSSINGDTSSVIPGSSSSVILSGGSAGVEGSSSSSAKSSSSVNSSSSVKSSSSSSVKSSSSVASSSSAKSSSSFVKVDYTNPSLSYGELEDPRDHRKYKYLTIRGKNEDGKRDSVTVMAENLNVGKMVQGSEDQTNDWEIEKYCYNNDSLNCIQYGGLYQWAEAMQLPSECNTKSCADQIKPNHQGICPDGWRLLTYDDFYIVVHADENVNPLVEGVRAMSFGGHNYSGYSLLGGGMRITPSGNFKEKNEVAYWFYPGEKEYENYSCGDDGYMGNTSKYLKTNVSYKQNGLSIRCVMDE
ncbi:MAG: hypothetical protein MJZ10_14650 [Fibrobacter sp.]|nr:hypothetical protein [Fibrobacter sp.]